MFSVPDIKFTLPETTSFPPSRSDAIRSPVTMTSVSSGRVIGRLLTPEVKTASRRSLCLLECIVSSHLSFQKNGFCSRIYAASIWVKCCLRVIFLPLFLLGCLQSRRFFLLLTEPWIWFISILKNAAKLWQAKIDGQGQGTATMKYIYIAPCMPWAEMEMLACTCLTQKFCKVLFCDCHNFMRNHTIACTYTKTTGILLLQGGTVVF